MPEIHVSVTAPVGAPPSVVYGIIADYKGGHPAILPAKYFQNLRVTSGGVGAGTRISFEMMAMGRTTTLHAEISEPEPGRLLHERYPAEGMLTTFTVDSREEGLASMVTIETSYQKGGVAGWIERLIIPGFLRTVFTAELAQLDQVARARQST
jgi:hypothetical protein